jgi:hypothetical protein
MRRTFVPLLLGDSEQGWLAMRVCAVSSAPAVEGGTSLILPCQYHELSGGYQLTGEQRLMLALLIDAINVYQRGAMSSATRARRLYVDAEHWIMTNSFHVGALSFDMVCDALGINTGLLRRRIVDWKHSLRRQHGSHTGSPLRLRITPPQRQTSRRRGRPPANSIAAQ